MFVPTGVRLFSIQTLKVVLQFFYREMDSIDREFTGIMLSVGINGVQVGNSGRFSGVTKIHFFAGVLEPR